MSLYECPECGSPLIGTPSGSTCPEGCTGILPKMPPKIRRINEAKVAGFPTARSYQGHYIVDGHDGEFTPGNVVTGKPTRTDKDDNIVAIDGDRLRAFIKKES